MFSLFTNYLLFYIIIKAGGYYMTILKLLNYINKNLNTIIINQAKMFFKMEAIEDELKKKGLQ